VRIAAAISAATTRPAAIIARPISAAAVVPPSTIAALVSPATGAFATVSSPAWPKMRPMPLRRDAPSVLPNRSARPWSPAPEKRPLPKLLAAPPSTLNALRTIASGMRTPRMTVPIPAMPGDSTLLRKP
jgi:hypothetical protein